MLWIYLLLSIVFIFFFFRGNQLCSLFLLHQIYMFKNSNGTIANWNTTKKYDEKLIIIPLLAIFMEFVFQKITIRSNRVWIVHSRIDELTGCRKRREFNVIFHFVHTFHSTRSIKNWNYCVIVTKSGKTDNKNWKMRKQQISLMPCHDECKNCVCTISFVSMDFLHIWYLSACNVWLIH